MTKFPDRQSITEKVMAIIKPDHVIYDIDTAMVTWWRNIRSTGGFGLTSTGAKAFEQAEFEYQEFDAGARLGASHSILALKLDKYMPATYYLHIINNRQKIRVYDSRVSMMIVLCDSDVNAYLESLSHVGTLRKR
jgi:hypothetical protein